MLITSAAGAPEVYVAPSSARTEVTSRRLKALFLSPIVILFASAARLLLISNYDTTTATTLAASAGVVGTLLGTIVPLLPLFLPAILIFFIVVRRWGLAVLTALLTTLVSPAYIGSVKEGIGVTANWAKGIWRGVADGWPGLPDGVTHIAQIVWSWIAWALGYILVVLKLPLRLLGVHDRQLSEWRHHVLLVWDSWPLPVRIAGICALTALLWVLYSPPWEYFPRQRPFHRLRERITRLLWVPNTAVRISGIVAYGIGVAALCGFFALYVETAYRVPLTLHTVTDILRRPWLPTERIQLSSGDALVGYTMSIGNGWHVFLIESDRTIRYLHAAQVTERKVCRITPPEPIRHPLYEPPGVVRGKIDPCETVPAR